MSRCSGNRSHSINSSNTIDRDSYCWKCHKECDNQVDCSKCSLTFHVRCLNRPDLLLTPNWLCPECETIIECFNEERNINNIRGSLECVIDSIIRENQNLLDNKFEIPDNYDGNPLLVYPITLMDIRHKAKHNVYNCTAGLLLDIKWLVHNSCILIEESTDCQLTANNLRGRAQKLLELSVGQIDWLKACPDCYSRGHNEFLMPCTKPHLLLWVQYEGEYWPAKLMNILPDYKVDVQFFGEFSSADANVDDCYLLSRSDPNIWRGKKKPPLFTYAISEVEKHVKQIRDMFGTFKYARPKTKLVIADMDKHLDDMVPGYRNIGKQIKSEQLEDIEMETANESVQQLQHQYYSEKPPTIVKQVSNAENVNDVKFHQITQTSNANSIDSLRSEFEGYIRTLNENYQQLQERYQHLQNEHRELQLVNRRQSDKIQNLELEVEVCNNALEEKKKQFLRRQEENRKELAALKKSLEQQ